MKPTDISANTHNHGDVIKDLSTDPLMWKFSLTNDIIFITETAKEKL